MENWNANIDIYRPCWDGYRELLARLDGASFPDAVRLNALLPPGAVSGSNAPLRFVPAGALKGVAYERHIFETGQVPTRERNWHDLFNALAWCRWPRIKAAMNAMHYRHLGEHGPKRGSGRGTGRDALTLLDESGALVIARNRQVLEALARRDWQPAFRQLRGARGADVRVVLCGHALLEKSRAPYKSMTAHALLLQVDTMPLRGEALLRLIDAKLADRLSAAELCTAPADLAPLPLAGIPGWWQAAPQDGAFYADIAVFRPSAADLQPALLHDLGVL